MPSNTTPQLRERQSKLVFDEAEADQFVVYLAETENGSGDLKFIGLYKGDKRGTVVAAARKTIAKQDGDDAARTAVLVSVKPRSIRATGEPVDQAAQEAVKAEKAEARQAERAEAKAVRDNKRADAKAAKDKERAEAKAKREQEKAAAAKDNGDDTKKTATKTKA